MPSELLNSKAARIKTVASQIFNIDNGNGTTIDDAVIQFARAVRLVRAYILYTTATAGTVAAANVTVGTAVDGEEIVAATAYENSKAVGTTTSLTLVTTYLAPGSVIHVRHTGIASTVAGEARVVFDYILFDD